LKVQEKKASGQFCDDLQENLGQAAVGWTSEENDGRFLYTGLKLGVSCF
jgi:hypothetical protein